MNQTFFLSHAAPTVCVDDSLLATFLKEFKKKVLSLKPKGIVVVSAHWDTSEPVLTTNPGKYDTIYDYGGYVFPESLYQLKYPASGAPELAKKVKGLLIAAGFNEVQEDEKRGLDHGAWVLLMLMYPEADIPVCELSVQSSRTGTYHYEMGRALAPLKEEGCLIIGSGTAVHNLSACRPSQTVDSWAMEFDNWLKEALLDGRYHDVNHYEEMAPNATTAHPCPEHLYPLHVAMGAAGKESKAELIHSSWGYGCLSYACYKFVATE